MLSAHVTTAMTFLTCEYNKNNRHTGADSMHTYTPTHTCTTCYNLQFRNPPALKRKQQQQQRTFHRKSGALGAHTERSFFVVKLVGIRIAGPKE